MNPLRIFDRLAGWWLDWRMGWNVAHSPDVKAAGLSLKRASLEQGKFEAMLAAPESLVLPLVQEMSTMLAAAGAEAYIGIDFMPRPDKGIRPIRVTIQYADRYSPAEKAARLVGVVNSLREGLVGMAVAWRAEANSAEALTLWHMAEPSDKATAAEYAMKALTYSKCAEWLEAIIEGVAVEK